MTDHWEHLWHPFRSLEVHYNENAWKLLKKGQLKVWSSFNQIEVDTEDINWSIDPLNNKTWRLYFHSLNWLYSLLWGIDFKNEEPDKLHNILLQSCDYLDSSEINDMAWFDHTTSDRLCILTAIIKHPSFHKMEESILAKLNNIIFLHINKISDYYKSEFWFDSNHGVFHALAMLNISQIYKEGPNGIDVKEIGVEYLKTSLKGILSIEEGISLEQSSYYHQLGIELVESIDDSYLQMIGINKNEFIDRMILANYWFTSFENKLVPIGDTSVISKAAKQHVLSDEKEKLKTFTHGGLTVVKSKSENNTSYFAMLHRKKRGPHGHFDALSVVLEKNNSRFLIDSGGPYDYGSEMRYGYFMSSYAHNVLLINERPHQKGAIFIGSRQMNSDVFIVEAEHKGYSPITHKRTCIIIEKIGLIVIDKLFGVCEPVDIKLLWHFDPDCVIDLANNRITNQLESIEFSSSENNYSITSGNENGIFKSWVTDKISNKIASPMLINQLETDADVTIISAFGNNCQIKCELQGNILKYFSDDQDGVLEI